MIILTAPQAAGVAGPTAPGYALEPRALADGTFALPERVLTDPAHASRWPVLNPLPTRAVAANEWAAS